MSVMSHKEITDLLPHRYPFLLVDRVTELEAKKRIVGYKNVTINEDFFNGHFPNHPIMPGVLILEALAQVAGLMGLATMEKERVENTVYYFAGMDKVRFKKPVLPGDKLELEARYITDKRGIWRFDCEARVDGQLACTAEIMCAERELSFD